MANTDAPRGFTPAKHAHGGRIIARKYLSGGGAIIYPGDALIVEADGDMTTMTADTGMCGGIAATYAAAVDQDEVWVYDDPAIIFMVQMTGTTVADDKHSLYNHLATTGDTTTLRSKNELNTASIVQDIATFRLLDKVDNPNNAWGEFVLVLCEIVEHRRQRRYDAGSAGI